MPAKANPETPAEQVKRFRKAARKLAKSGELNTDEAAHTLDRLVAGQGDSNKVK